MLKKYEGSCHCRKVKFEVKLDLSQGIRKCNCTYCYKTKYQKVFAKEPDLSIKSGEDHLTDYRAPDSSWPPGAIHHFFCRVCGIQVFSKGYLEVDPFNGWFYAVNVASLDSCSPEEIIQSPVIYEDGLHDRQMETPEETRHL